LTCGVREDVTLKLTGGFAAPISIPEFSSVNDDSVDYNQTVKYTKDTLVCARDFRLKTVEFSPEEYQKLRQTLKDMDYDVRKSLILALSSKKKEAVSVAKSSAEPPVESNAKLLDSEKML